MTTSVVAPPARFPGWRVVAATFVCLTTTAGFGFYGLAVYLNQFVNERGWKVSSVSGATAVFFLVSAPSGLLIARLLDRFDVRFVVTGGGLLGAGALLMLGRSQQVWHVYAAYAVLAVAHSAAGLVSATTVVTRWFHAKRSTAFSIASTGLSVGGVVITPAVKVLLSRRGMADAAPWMALGWMLGIIPVTLLLMRSDPRRAGWMPDGAPLAPSSEPAAPPPGERYASAVRSRFFVTVTIAYVLILGAQVGGIQQLVKVVTERGSVRAATLATSVLAGASVVARLIGGQVARRTEMSRLTMRFGAVQALALGAIAFAPSAWTLILAIVLFGATIGNLLMLHPLLIAERFGVRDYARIYSRSSFFMMLGTASGPFVMGWLRDHAGGYRVAYSAVGALSFIGVLVLSRSGPATNRANPAG